VKARKLVIAALLGATLAATGACGRKELEDGGVYTRRSVCPQVAIPAATSIARESDRSTGSNKVTSPVAAGIATCGQTERRV
jgi:hypothetical protein